jgi:hypothetical protein
MRPSPEVDYLWVWRASLQGGGSSRALPRVCVCVLFPALSWGAGGSPRVWVWAGSVVSRSARPIVSPPSRAGCTERVMAGWMDDGLTDGDVNNEEMKFPDTSEKRAAQHTDTRRATRTRAHVQGQGYLATGIWPPLFRPPRPLAWAEPATPPGISRQIPPASWLSARRR